jgi:hypothetical protein
MTVNHKNRSNLVIKLTAAGAIAFGLLTVFAGSRVLMDLSDPGYTVFLPLLIFNTVMGFAYIATGILIWKTSRKALIASKSIFLLNLAVFCIVFLLFFTGEKLAFESIISMGFRTIVWWVIYWVVKITED